MHRISGAGHEHDQYFKMKIMVKMMYESTIKIKVKFPCFTWSFSANYLKSAYYTRKTEVCCFPQYLIY